VNKKIEDMMNQCNSIQNLEEIDYRTLCSWLLILSPTEMIILSAILGVLISRKLTPIENNIIGQFLSTVGSNLQLAAAQQEFFNRANEEKQKLIQNQQKAYQQKNNTKEEKNTNDKKETGKQ
jgi:uncharacterized protein YacL